MLAIAKQRKKKAIACPGDVRACYVVPALGIPLLLLPSRAYNSKNRETNSLTAPRRSPVDNRGLIVMPPVVQIRGSTFLPSFSHALNVFNMNSSTCV